MNDEIDRYLALLARRLAVPATERETILEEVRSHLEERMAAALAEGQDQQTAARAAIQAFGDARRVAAQFSAARQGQSAPWRRLGYLGAISAGAFALWAIWTLGTFPVYVYYSTVYPVFSLGHRIAPYLVLEFIQSTPVCSGAFAVFTLLGWVWLAPLIALFCVAPFLWGLRAERWWAPALVYGVGAWLSAPWFVFFLVGADWQWETEARVIALALPLALVAAALGALWGRYRRAQASAIASLRLA